MAAPEVIDARPSFRVECYWPGITEEQVREVLAGPGRTRPNPGSHDDPVRSVGCILVPTDGMALFLFEGPSAELVRDRGTRAEVPFDRIVEAVRIESGDGPQ